MLGEQYEMETEGQEGVGRGSVWRWQGVWILFSGQLELVILVRNTCVAEK